MKLKKNSVENTIDTLFTDCMRNTVGNIWLAQLQKSVYNSRVWLWIAIITWCAVHCFSSVHCTQCIVIQIKICAEYRDMLPRPRLVCQEPGLRPIGRSPGVPDKSSRGLGSMSRYSAQILICFIAYIFLIFFHSSVGLVGNCRTASVHSALCHCPL